MQTGVFDSNSFSVKRPPPPPLEPISEYGLPQNNSVVPEIRTDTENQFFLQQS